MVPGYDELLVIMDALFTEVLIAFCTELSGIHLSVFTSTRFTWWFRKVL